jgi:hypothetical protein
MRQEQQRLRAIIEQAKELRTYPGINWDDPAWDITEYENSRAHRKSRFTLYFTRQREQRSEARVPFAQPFADFAKAIVRMRASHRDIKYSGQERMTSALRVLYEGLLRTGSRDPTTLTRQHFHQAIIDSHQTYGTASAYNLSTAILEIADFLDYHRISRVRLNFKNPLRYPGKGDRLDPESQARGLQKLPPPAVLEALADISNHPRDDNERILLRIIDLLVAGGFRIGEGLTIPLDCWVEEQALDRNGKLKINPQTGAPIKRCGIRYWPEKGGAPIVKWLPDAAVPLGKRAVVDLTQLCAQARAVAAELERHPDRVPIPGAGDPNQLMDLKQLASLLGLSGAAPTWYFVANLGVALAGTKREEGHQNDSHLYRIGDVEKALLRRRKSLVVLRKPNGQKQMLSESLCVMFRNQFHASFATLTFLTELVGFSQIAEALGKRPDASSIFSRRGLTESDGSPMHVNTHAFRHWLNTLADRGGLTDIELARWMGRRDLDQNEAYKHGTVAQRVAWAQEMIKVGKLHGPVAEIYHTMRDPIEKEQFLEAFVDVAHFTHFGVCTHDFALEPCKYHLNCLSGCSEYLRTKGDQEERKHITEVRDFHLVQLESYKKAAQAETFGASNWVHHAERIVAGANAALAVDDHETTEIGATAPVFPAGRKMGKPIASDAASLSDLRAGLLQEVG